MTAPNTDEARHLIHEGRDGENQYVLHPSDNDVFVQTGKQVIEACKLGISIDIWLDEFGSMLKEVSKWSEENTKIRACYCSPVGSCINLFFSPNSETYDFDLADELTTLNHTLIRKFKVGIVEVHQVPFDELDRFISVETARKVHGSDLAAHQSVET